MNLILAQCRKIEWIHLALYKTSDQQSMDLMADHYPTRKSLAQHSSEHFWEVPPLSFRAILHDITVLEVPRYTGPTFSEQALNSVLRRTPNLQRLDAHGVHMDASSLSKREAKRFAAQDKRKQRESRQVAAQ
ncbi:hypothetical protein BGZ81_002339 [Podila clonocystis]|nr:hypothetical protein BGZ81_002339 [Podila clonocystis]